MTPSTPISASAEPGAPLLTVRDLRIETRDRSPAALIENVSFDIRAGETLALVGESGAGKSLSALAILGLLPPDAMRVTGGEIRLGAQSLSDISPRQLRKVRGGRVAMIFQDPLGCLNPVLTVGRQITEALHLHKGLRGAAARRRGRRARTRRWAPRTPSGACRQPPATARCRRSTGGLAAAV